MVFVDARQSQRDEKENPKKRRRASGKLRKVRWPGFAVNLAGEFAVRLVESLNGRRLPLTGSSIVTMQPLKFPRSEEAAPENFRDFERRYPVRERELPGSFEAGHLRVPLYTPPNRFPFFPQGSKIHFVNVTIRIHTFLGFLVVVRRD